MIIQFPQEIGSELNKLHSDLFLDKINRQFINDLKENIKEELSEEVVKKLENLHEGMYTSLISNLMYHPLRADDKKKYFRDILSRLKEFKLQRQIIEVKNKLEELDPQLDKKIYDELFQELVELESTKRDL